MFTAVLEEVQKHFLRRTPENGRELHLRCFLVLFLLLDYHVDNGCFLEKTTNKFNFMERIRILASDGSFIVISRDAYIPVGRSKYIIEPLTLAVDICSVKV